VLFVAWDGPDQSYLESLFLPIHAQLAEHGFDFHVMQFRWGPDAVIASARQRAGELGVPYTHERVLRRPLSLGTATTVALGSRAIRRYVARHGIDIVMPRSTIPAAMTLLARSSIPHVLFDADGLAADERVDFAGWRPTGANYRVFREVEAQMLRVAQSVITRTDRARRTLTARAGAGLDEAKIHIIPNGKDEHAFSPGDAESRARARAAAGLPGDAPVIVYAGSLGPQYFPDEMLALFSAIHRRRPDARLIMLTGQQENAHTAVERAGVAKELVSVERVPADEVPRHLAMADLGLALREPSYSQRAVSPIKVSEYLLCGLPVLATRGVGDLDAQLDARVGRLLERPDPESLEAAAAWFVNEALPNRSAFREAARAQGVKLFGLTRCVDRHAEALRYALRPARPPR